MCRIRGTSLCWWSGSSPRAGAGRSAKHRDLLDPGSEPARGGGGQVAGSAVIVEAVMKRTYPLLLTWNKGLEARRDAKAQLVDVGRLVLTVDLNSDAGLQGCLIFRMKQRVSVEHCSKGKYKGISKRCLIWQPRLTLRLTASHISVMFEIKACMD